MSNFSLRRTADMPISEESAREQVLALLEHYDIDIDSMDSERKGSAEASFEKLTRFYRMGIFENATADSFKVIQHLKQAPGAVKDLTYSEISGKNRIASDGKKSDQRMSMVYAMMGSLTGLGEGPMQDLSGIDLAAMETLGLVFLML